GPDGTWFKGESIDYVRRLLYNRNARIYDYLDRKAVQALVDEHLEGVSNRRLLIWSLIYLENLMEIFVGQRNQFEQPAIVKSRSESRRSFVTSTRSLPFEFARQHNSGIADGGASNDSTPDRNRTRPRRRLAISSKCLRGSSRAERARDAPTCGGMDDLCAA